MRAVNNNLKMCVSAALIGSAALMSTTSAAAPAQRLNDACWDTTFFEPFDELRLARIGDTSGWTTQYIWDRNTIINQEMQYYVDPRVHAVNPFSIDDGVLSITATKTPSSMLNTTQNQPYISGVLTSRNWFEQKYGRFEVMAKVPKGKGLWSAFWMLPTHESWPQGIAVLPELDIMEQIGDELGTYHTTLHTNQTGKLTSQAFDHNSLGDLSQRFHLYSAVWTSSDVSWYFDGQLVASHPSPADFNTPKHFLLNLAVGGGWPGAPDQRTQFPAHYDIDYVKAMVPNSRCN